MHSPLKTTDRVLIVVMGGICALLAAGLWALWIHFVSLWMRSGSETTDLEVWMTWVFAFEFFFTRIAWSCLRRIQKTFPPLMTVKEWQRLSVFLFAIGGVGGGLFHWAACMAPWTLSLLCLFLDCRIQGFLAQLTGVTLPDTSKETA